MADFRIYLANSGQKMLNFKNIVRLNLTSVVSCGKNDDDLKDGRFVFA